MISSINIIILYIIIVTATSSITNALEIIPSSTNLIWQNITTFHLPKPTRGEFTFTKDINSKNNDIYLYGGCDITFSIFYNDLWLLTSNKSNDEKKMKWKYIKTYGKKPNGSCGHGAVILNNTLYIYGGLISNGISNKLYALNLKTYIWRQVQAKENLFYPNSRALIQHSMAKTSEYTFIVGSGTSTDKFDDDSTYEFNIKTMEWNKISDGQCPNTNKNAQECGGNVGGSSIVYDKTSKSLILLGGYKNGTLNELGSLRREERPNQEWKKISTINNNNNGSKSRFNPIAFQAARMIYNVENNKTCMIVEGGFDQLKLNNKLWVLNIETDENDNLNGMWKSLETKFQPPSHFASGFEIVNNRYIVIFGGRIHPRGKHEELWNGLWILDLGKNIDSIC